MSLRHGGRVRPHGERLNTRTEILTLSNGGHSKGIIESRTQRRSNPMIHFGTRLNEKLNDFFFPPGQLRYVTRFRDLTRKYGVISSTVLHVGAGRVDLEPLVCSDGRTRRVLALDLSFEDLRENSGSLKICGDAEALPVAPKSVDLIVAEHVFEHFPRPLKCLNECFRVLKDGGRLVVSGPNGWCYVALFARLTPLRFHRLVRSAQNGALGDQADAFPTFYRFSTPRAMRKLASEAGFRVSSIEKFIAEPCYTTFLPVVHWAFIGLHLVMKALKPVFGFHVNTVAVFEKPILVSASTRVSA